MAYLDYKELKRQLELSGPGATCQHIREGLREKWFRPDDFSLRKLAEAICGHEWVQQLDPRMGNDGVSLMEAGAGGGGQAVTTATFSNITGQIVYNRVIEAAQNPAFIADQLCETIPTQFNGEIIPEIGGIGDKTLLVTEAAAYPFLGVEQAYIKTPETKKRGGIVSVTKEAIFFDRTNLVLRQCSQLGYWAGLNKEKEVLKVVLGSTNPYSRNGTTHTTYLTTGGHGVVNKNTSATYLLKDWTDIEQALTLFNQMTDFMTGERIVVMPTQLLVPWNLFMTAMTIIHATETRGGTSNATSYQSLSPSPLSKVVTLDVITSPLVYSISEQTNDWWIGDFKKAFAYMENWGITTTNRSGGTDAEFYRDIIQEYKVSWRGIGAVLDPHYAMQFTGGS